MEYTNELKKMPENTIFSLDIGTRSIIGIVGMVKDEKFQVIAIEQEFHGKRAMVDGQIEDIEQVAKVTRIVKERLEEKLKYSLTHVCVAAAGRALKTQRSFYEMDLKTTQKIDEELIGRLEAGAISEAEAQFCDMENEENRKQFYLVGYSVTQYLLDNYPISSLRDHHGKNIRADVIATFLPSEVVESLYTTMHKIGLEVASLTLEPIAAINAAIPENLRLLNLVLVDIGAGTSDIAVSKDGSVVGYTMATLAGDEITETLMKKYLIDFNTAELIKFDMADKEEVTFMDILGLENTVSMEDVYLSVEDSFQSLCKEISDKILEVNAVAPSAVFLAGGGSKLSGIRESIAKNLKMDISRVAIAGNNFQINAFSDEFDLNNPEYATPLGIAVSAGLNLINDSFYVMLNGKRAKLFRSGSLSVVDILMMNGYTYQDLMGRSGQSIVVTLDGKRAIYYGGHATPSVLKLNGADTKVSSIISAGDTIDFIPAVSGKPAEITLRELLKDIDGVIEAEITLNGNKSPMDTQLKTGDIIKTNRPDSESTVSAEEDLLVTYRASEEEVVPVISGATELTPVKNYHFKYNNEPLEVKGKADGNPIYLMDMLEYSDIDFDHPDGIVVLKVNGLSGSFLQELYDNDSIEIYCEKENSSDK